jgi:lipopolysaccharide export system protein LptC
MIAGRPNLVAADRPMSRSRHALGPASRAVLARYSRFVGFMKVLLPAIGAALFGLIVLWPQLSQRIDRGAISFSHVDLARADTMSMQNPRYFGTDNKNLPFTLTAKVATQVDPQDLTVTLEKPIADLTRPDGTGVVINSELGFFRQKIQLLDMLGKVDLYLDTGYELHTESARINVGDGSAAGDEAVYGQGPTGTIEGDGFRMTSRGKIINCLGRCKAVLSMAKSKAKS